MSSSKDTETGLFSFRGQYFHTTNAIPCKLCGKRVIHDVFTLHHPDKGSLGVGSCCFPRIKKVQPSIFPQLMAAKTLLEAAKAGLEADVKEFNHKGDMSFHANKWKRLKRRAKSKVKDFAHRSKDGWLPQPLFELKVEADKVPGKTLRWYKNHISILQNMLESI